MNTSNNRFRDFRNQRSTEKENRYEYPIESFPDEIQQLILEMKENNSLWLVECLLLKRIHKTMPSKIMLACLLKLNQMD